MDDSRAVDAGTELPPAARAADGAAQLEQSSLVDLAVDRLRRDILGGVLPPGERLVEEQVRVRLGISRAPLREALRLLAQQGLVEHLPRRGVRVATLSPSDVHELFDLREVLERHVVGLVLSASPQRLAALRRELQLMEAAAAERDAFAMAEAHRRFHVELVALAGHRQLLLAYEPVLLKLQLAMATNLRREAEVEAPDGAVRRHAVLLAAVEAGDTGQVLTALADHGSRRYLTPATSPAD